MIARNWVILPIAMMLGCARAGGAGTLEDNLSAYTDQTAEGYLKPLQTAFGQGLNSNLFTTAAVPSIGFHAHFDIKAMSMLYDDADKTFMATTGGDFTPAQQVKVPTAVGSTESVIVDGDSGTQYIFPGGFDLSSFSFGVPQLTVSGLGTEVMVRWLGFSTGTNEVGDVSLLGLGIRHGISRYVPSLGFDLSAGFYYNKFSVDTDLVDVETYSFGLQASKGFPVLSPYGGLSYDTVEMSSVYTANVGAGEETIHLDMKTEKTFHATGGANMNLGFFHANGALDFAKHFGVSVGVGVGF